MRREDITEITVFAAAMGLIMAPFITLLFVVNGKSLLTSIAAFPFTVLLAGVIGLWLGIVVYLADWAMP